ncbi:nucleotide-sugar transporter [Ascodesmis nigricans]|uniref:Nucleotide-sugar transporter n=1 Tax=Ascodesmis nigricans TaxID=341454 RepID=A0A4S2N4T1_9PEZI|nr:nucleotide-sugar transporter [Ascodesmis nigricans]
MPAESGRRFLASTAVLMNEILKLAFCVAVAFRDRRKADGSMTPLAISMQKVVGEVFQKDHWKLSIPAFLYVVQNRLQYLAVSNLDAATFQVTYQLKILTTALFSVTMLHRRLSHLQWLALVLLTAGIAIVQLPTSSPSEAKHTKRSGSYEGIHADRGSGQETEPEMNATVGLIAVIVACMLSGLAGVYFEKVLKTSSATLWIRNIQLSLYSLLPAALGVVLMDGAEVAKRGFFDGYNAVVWTTVIFQASGGIIVALCVKFADNILKNFATSISILISFVASVYFFDFNVTLNFIVGAALVIFATYLYSKGERTAPVPPQRTSAPEYVPLQNTRVDDAEDIQDMEMKPPR